MGPLKTVLIAAALVLGSMPSMALRLANYEAVFEQSDIDPLNILPLGFGRPDGFGRADDQPAPLSLASSSGRSSLALDAAVPGTDAFNPGVLPFGFHDIWTFTGLAPGSYSFNTTLAASGQLAFGLVLYEWYAQGSLQSVDFSVAPNLLSAQGSGTFTVDAACAATGCARLHIWGWDDGVASGNYTGTTTVTPVPEPETWALMLAGVVALGALARRRQGQRR